MSDRYDLVTVGRVNMDLYSRDVGAEFSDIPSGFDAMVGGSPTNIAIGTARHGLRTIALTAVGDDEIGTYVRAFLDRERVVTDFIPTKPQGKTALAILGVIPPDRFPLIFYRDNAADLHLDRADVDALPLGRVDAMLLSGNAFARGTCRDASEYALARAQELGLHTYLDLDLRPDQWSTPNAFGDEMQGVLSKVTVALGTEEEFHAALVPGSPAMAGQPLTEDQRAEVRSAVESLTGPEMIVLKRGSQGVTLLDGAGRADDVGGFPVDVVNTVGAGDAFASGLIARRQAGDAWPEAARFANACGAIVVTRHGCSLALPTPVEVREFMDRLR